jgi:F0F1-type ATP synthase membrane subunit b/b'
MEAAVRAAKLELKNHAAQQAVDLAGGLIRQRLDEPGRSRLVKEFAATLHS